jgi:broad specificity phosphatase PhoE
MRALFLRHGESAHNAHTGEEPLSEELGDLLTERGREQAIAAGAALRGAGVTRLYSSPMRRAAETAEAVGAALDMAVEPIPFAHEFHAGETASSRASSCSTRSSASASSRRCWGGSGTLGRPTAP